MKYTTTHLKPNYPKSYSASLSKRNNYQNKKNTTINQQKTSPPNQETLSQPRNNKQHENQQHNHTSSQILIRNNYKEHDQLAGASGLVVSAEYHHKQVSETQKQIETKRKRVAQLRKDRDEDEISSA